jgi:hypothetical protein
MDRVVLSALTKEPAPKPGYVSALQRKKPGVGGGGAGQNLGGNSVNLTMVPDASIARLRLAQPIEHIA